MGIMYSVVYAKYRIFIVMLTAIKLSVIMQSVVVPLRVLPFYIFCIIIEYFLIKLHFFSPSGLAKIMCFFFV